MLTRFNFYDLYGYLAPGIAMVLLAVAPLVLDLHRAFPFAALGSAIVGIVAAYLVGHIIQGYASRWLPSRFASNGKLEPPSHYLLNDPAEVSAPLRAEIARVARERFHLDIEDPGQRRDAFFLLRSLLLLEGKASYAEQFQGLYSLTRGGMVALSAGAAWIAGWSLLAQHARASAAVLVCGLLLGLLPPTWVRKPLEWRAGARLARATLAALSLLPAVLAGMGGGGLAGLHWGATPFSPVGLLVVPLLLLAAGAFDAHRRFAQQFALTVYRDGWALATRPEKRR